MDQLAVVRIKMHACIQIKIRYYCRTFNRQIQKDAVQKYKLDGMFCRHSKSTEIFFNFLTRICQAVEHKICRYNVASFKTLLYKHYKDLAPSNWIFSTQSAKFVLNQPISSCNWKTRWTPYIITYIAYITEYFFLLYNKRYFEYKTVCQFSTQVTDQSNY